MVVYRDGEWQPVSQPLAEPATKPKRKRAISDAMKAASRANGRKGRGATSESGRARAALNATKHALTSSQLILVEGESPGVFDAQVARWVRQLGAKTEPEVDQVKIAVHNEWKALRSDMAEASAVNRAVNTIRDEFQNGKALETWEWIPKLASEPKKTVQKLMTSAYGCSALIQKLQILAEWLLDCSSFEISDRALALNLGGHDPKDLFVDPVVMDINRAYLGGIRGKDGYTAAQAANALQADRPDAVTPEEFERRLERHVLDLPTVEEGVATLQKYVSDVIDRLTQWKKLIELREERDLTDAIGEAKSDVTTAGSKRNAYGARNTRLQFAALRMLFALQRERREFGEGDLSEPEAPESTGEEAQTESTTVLDTLLEGDDGAPEDLTENEPVVSEVVDSNGSNNASETRPEVNPAAPAASAGDPLESIIEKYQREFDHLREYDHLE